MLEYDIVRRILCGADFLLDHALLALEFFRIEGRIGENIGQYIEAESNVGLEHARVIGGGFVAGGSIEITTDRLDFFRNLLRRSPCRTLERHMFQQMRHAVLIGLFVAAANAGPYAKCRGLQMLHRVGDDRQSRWKLGDFDAHPAIPCFAARLTERMNRSTSA